MCLTCIWHLDSTTEQDYFSILDKALTTLENIFQRFQPFSQKTTNFLDLFLVQQAVYKLTPVHTLLGHNIFHQVPIQNAHGLHLITEPPATQTS